MSEKDTDQPLVEQVESILQLQKNAYDAVLGALLARFDCVTGTIHMIEGSSGMLKLVAAQGIPDAIMDRVRMIPIGKGMAGLAAERKEAVQVCNLQQDDSGVAKPAAKLTQMAGSVAVPMMVDGDVVGTLGVARPDEYEFSQVQIDLLMQVGESLGQRLKA
jgi:putative methionine-R-sulfoxide reductase with GAF domain